MRRQFSSLSLILIIKRGIRNFLFVINCCDMSCFTAHQPPLRHHSGHFRHKMALLWDPHPQYEFAAFGRRFHLMLAHDSGFVHPELQVCLLFIFRLPAVRAYYFIYLIVSCIFCWILSVLDTRLVFLLIYLFVSSLLVYFVKFYYRH